MSQVLIWVALGLSVLAFAHAFSHLARSKAGPPAELKPFLFGSLALLAAGALLTLPTRPPWSPGQTLAPGFVLGGLAVLAAAALSRARVSGEAEAQERPGFFQAALQVALPTAGVAVLLLLYPRNVLDALSGYALGALTVGILTGCGSLLVGEDEAGRGQAVGAETATLAAVGLSLATYLATYHLSLAGAREWQPLPVLLTGALAVLLNVRGILSGPGRSWVRSVGLVLVPLTIVGAIAGYRLNGGDLPFLLVLVVSLVGYALIAWLDTDPGSSVLAPRVDTGLLASLLTLGIALLAFQKLHGYGIGLACLGGLAVLTGLPARESRRHLVRSALALGLLLVGYRVYVESGSETAAFEPDFLYYYVALVLGALLPAFLAGSTVRWMEAAGNRSSLSALLRVGLAGAAAALAPLVLWLLVGDRPQGAFLVGLAVGAGFLLAGYRSGETAETAAAERSLARLLPLGMALSAIQFTFLLDPLALMKRGERIGILIGLAAAALIWIAVVTLRDRMRPPATVPASDRS